LDIPVPHPPIVSEDEWRDERLKLLAHEKELTKEYDRLNAERRRLPMVRLEKSYSFDGPNGKESLLGLFDGQRQLIVYHFMFDPAWDQGCSGCTRFIQALGDLSMLRTQETSFVVVSRAPIEKLEKYKAKMGWDIPWFSSFGSDFNYDFHVTLDPKVAPVEYNYQEVTLEGEQPGLSVFFQMDGEIFHTYSTYARGTESRTDAYRLLDLTPFGRQEDFEVSPEGWPQKPTYGG
jgi:predicted dithiol-disulfide oxidoreductase (DUF899 family)